VPSKILRTASWSFVLAALFLALASPARADDIVTIPASLPYASDAVGTADIRRQCSWTTSVPLVIAAQSGGRVATTTQDLAGVPGKVLLITVTDLGAAAGGTDLPKWITIHGELREGGKPTGSFHFRRATKQGRMSTCATLSFLGNQLGQDVLGWLANPIETGTIPAATLR